ncbi:hypothetical protein BD560DRAFT_412294 [Blakeslea trispora]|nr:hypothetical protein BD560DRAFT_412294 [Blakeslea trispora]
MNNLIYSPLFIFFFGMAFSRKLSFLLPSFFFLYIHISMTSVSQLGLDTVVNQQAFEESVVIEECPVVGRSLVAKKPLVPGDIVLVETPLIQYDLEPTCRSNKSPYYSKKLWKLLVNMVYTEEGLDMQKLDVSSSYDSSNNHDDDDYDDDDRYSEDDSEDEEHKETDNIQSEFYPGVPAAIVAYLQLHPPPSFNNVRKRKQYNQNDFDFFYFPNTDIEPAWLDHKTIKLIHTVTQKVVDTVPLYAHVDPFDLRSFVLKIYSNAHTVSLPRIRTAPTHSSKRSRREHYKSKFGDTTFWGEDAVEAPNTPTIALLRWGSKFAHSCSPNMFLRFEPSRNAMVFTITKPLAKGDVLSFSYLPEDDSIVGGLVYGTTLDRQIKLEKFKFFKCACERCLDWDWARGMLCKECQEPTSYRNTEDEWTCFACGSKTQDENMSFVGESEKHVEVTVMNLFSRVFGSRRLTQNTIQMLEPQLTDLLAEYKVSKTHWTFAVIQSILATYHLTLFPQSYGKGLASQMGMTLQGLEEALAYLEFLNDAIHTPKLPQARSKGNPMAVFFAGWRILSIVIDMVMDSTENKYANAVFEQESDSDEEDSQPLPTPKPILNNAPVLIPLDQSWVAPVSKMSFIANNQWIPLVEQIFKSQEAIVVQDMIRQIKGLDQRLNELTKL